VAVIGQILVQFVFRLTFGMATAMALTPARLVTSGYYRVHLWVLMGLNTLAALAVYSGRASDTAFHHWQLRLTLAIVLASLSYIGAVVWLYERARAGNLLLCVVAIIALGAAIGSLPAVRISTGNSGWLWILDSISSGLLMGSTMAAMLLGHWYLNTPSMQLWPLRKLILLMTGSGVLRGVVSGAGLAMYVSSGGTHGQLVIAFLAFRWLAGIFGALLMAHMARLTLRIPNTQSATGILYAGVILVFLGELTSQLLSVDARFPV